MLVTKAFSLEIGGLPFFFTGCDNHINIDTPAYLTALEPPDRSVSNINCIKIETVGKPEQTLKTGGGVATVATMAITLNDWRNQLSALFGTTVEGVPYVHLTETVNAANGATFLQYTGDGSFLGSEGWLWVAQECMYYTAVDDIAKVITISSRGVLGSDVRDHIVGNTPAKSFKPRVTAVPCFLLGASVILKEYTVKNGVVSEGVERFYGFVSTEPDPVGDTWVISIAQELNKTSQLIGSGVEQTGLVDNWVYNDPDAPYKISHTELIEQGTVTGAWGFGIQPDILSADHNLADADLLMNSVTAHENVFGTVRGNYPGTPATGVLTINAPLVFAALEVEPTGYLGVGVGYTIPPNSVAALDATQGIRVTNKDVHKRVDRTLPTGLIRWPAAGVDLFNQYYNCTLTVDGAFDFIDCSLSQDGKYLLVRDADFPDSYQHDKPPMLWNLGAAYDANRTDTLWYPWLHPADADAPELGSDGRELANKDYVNNVNLYRSNGRDVQPNGRGKPLSILASKSDAELTRLELRAPLTAFWQVGRKHLLIKDDILDSTGGALRVQNGEFSQVLEYESTAAVFDGGDTIGYLVTLSNNVVNNPDLISFGNGSGNKPTIAPYAVLPADPRRLILQILLSGNTTKGYPSAAHSLLPRQFGLSVSPKRVDEAGILSFPLSNDFAQEPFTQKKPITATKLLDDILVGMGAHLVMKTINGRRQITLVRDRNYSKIHIDASVEASDWVPDDLPGKGKKTQLVAQWSIYTNYDADTDKWGRVGNYYDTDVIDASNGVIVNPRTLNIQGLNVSEDAELLRLFASLRDRYGITAKIFTGSVLASVGNSFDVGDTIHIQALRGIGIDGVVNLDGLAYVVKHKYDPLYNRVSIVCIYKDTNRSGFAPEAQVTAVVDADTLTLSDNAYSLPTDNDAILLLGDSFSAPETRTLRAKLVGRESGNKDIVVTDWDDTTNTATVPAHGLLVGDTLAPLSWLVAETDHKKYVFLSASGVLGLVDPGYLYS